MKRRDLELLSAYLDGELKPSDSTKLEVRLKTDPELVSVLADLRAARALLRKLPSRKAPRNFTLNRRLAGQNPPLPRSYPAFRFVTALATLLFFFTFGLNFVGAQLAAQPPPSQFFGMGGGGNGDVELYAEESAPAPEAPAAEAAPAEPASGGEPSTSLAPQATDVPPAGDATRILETPSTKSAEGENAIEQQQIGDDFLPPSPLVPRAWQVGFLAAAVLGVALMQWMKRISAQRWD